MKREYIVSIFTREGSEWNTECSAKVFDNLKDALMAYEEYHSLFIVGKLETLEHVEVLCHNYISRNGVWTWTSTSRLAEFSAFTVFRYWEV